MVTIKVGSEFYQIVVTGPTQLWGILIIKRIWLGEEWWGFKIHTTTILFDNMGSWLAKFHEMFCPPIFFCHFSISGAGITVASIVKIWRHSELCFSWTLKNLASARSNHCFCEHGAAYFCFWTSIKPAAFLGHPSEAKEDAGWNKSRPLPRERTPVLPLP